MIFWSKYHFKFFVASWFIIIATPCICWSSSRPEYSTVSPELNFILPAPIHRHSLLPMMWILIWFITLATCADFSAVYIVLTFQFPILIWVLGVTSGLFSSWASSRLWLKGVIRCLSKQGTALAPRESCLRVFKVSVIHFVLRGQVIGPPPNPQPGGPGAVLCLASIPPPIRHG